MNKICTSLEQSQKLIELGIDVNTADMFYLRADIALGEIECYPNVLHREEVGDDIPAWSLAALMDVLDRGALFKTPKGWACQSYIEFKAITSDYYNNPIDACVAMIEKLHEQKLL